MTGLDGEPESALLDDRPAKPHPLLAWAVILIVAIVVIVFQRSRSQGDSGEQARVQERMAIGFAERKLGGGPQLLKQLEFLEQGSLRNQLRFVVMTGELDSPSAALKRLLPLEEKAHQSEAEDDLRLAELLRRLYTSYSDNKFTAVLDEADAAFLKKELDWLGEVALAPRQGDPAVREKAMEPARRVVVALLGMVMGGCSLGVLGLVLLIILLNDMYRHGNREFREGSAHGGFYVEAFAVWLIVFSLLSLLGSLVVTGHSRLLGYSLLTLLSLVAVAWPVLRGVPWATVKQDAGLTSGKGLLVEAGYGLLCYATCVPLLVTGVLLVTALTRLAEALGLDRVLPTTPGNHPIASSIPQADAWELVQIFVAASIVAPLIEELVFRGLLYRHLREATKGTGPGKSMFLSALVCSFLFAVIHPQGVMAVPALMSLALGFSIWRERRESLICCVVAHGLHNGMTLLLNVLIFR